MVTCCDAGDRRARDEQDGLCFSADDGEILHHSCKQQRTLLLRRTGKESHKGVAL